MRFRLALSGFLIAVISAQIGATSSLQQLSELQWQHRILLIQSMPSADSDIAQLIANQSEIEERHILWFVLSERGMQTNYAGPMSPQLDDEIAAMFSDPTREVVLIGKDGGIKSRADTFNLAELFEQIDAMPMRQKEIRQQKVAESQ
ncbi:DUF4174 domain-containing protein [Vibrio sp. WXL210]|uniref:DUF4174 domain-containing protein n=1 Tax=Vibrio sp. WXL210 TaxID=3450709 RepID=UPI003EC89C70